MTIRPLSLLAPLLLLLAAAPAAAQEETFHACYVPDVGAIYLIGLDGLPTECLSADHVEISWREGQAGITDHGALEGLGDDDHPEYVREGETAAGDLAGSFPAPMVAALRGRALAETEPAEGHVLVWNEADGTWEPRAPAEGITDHGELAGLGDDDHPEYVREGEVAGGDLGGTFPEPEVMALRGNPVASAAPSNGEVLTWSDADAAWQPAAVPGGITDHGDLDGLADDDHPEYVREGEAAGGDLSGTFPEPSVTALQGSPVTTAAPSDGQVLTWNPDAGGVAGGRGEGAWEPQTPASGVTDHGNLAGLADDDHTHYVLADGARGTTNGFSVTGEYGTGSITVEGAGTRVMWYPGKAAFRAGRVVGTQWDDANIGHYSVALGFSSTASRSYSMALGYATTANAEHATAMGNATKATSENSTAMGYRTEAGGWSSTAMGDNAEATGTGSTAMGSFTEAVGSYSTAIGYHTRAPSRASVAIGQYNSTSFGDENPLLLAGNGDMVTGASNALVLYMNGNLWIAGTLTESSDRRLKLGIEPLGPALDALRDLRPVRFRFRPDAGHPTDPQIGLIAQDVAEAFPELVSTDAEGYLSLAYPKLTAVLVRAIQEQQEQIEDQREELEALTARLERLEAAMERRDREDGR